MSSKITFKVKEGSELHQSYFISEEEKRKFRELSEKFKEKYSIKGRCYEWDTLAVEFETEENRKRFEDQIVKKADKQGFYKFKSRTPMQKAWEEMVIQNVNFRRMNKVQFLVRELISCGRYRLWELNGNIYGYIESKNGEDVELKEWMDEIPMEEYLAISKELG